jgi:hypothetical protein
VWGFALLDPLVLLILAVFQPHTFDWIWSKALVIVAAVKAFVAYFGLAQDGQQKTSFAELKVSMSDPFVASGVILYSIASYVLVFYLLTNGPTLHVHIFPPLNSPYDSASIAGKLIVRGKTDPNFLIDQAARFNVPIQMGSVRVDQSYKLMFEPTDPDYYLRDSVNIESLRLGATEETLRVSRRSFDVRFILDPENADLKVNGKPLSHNRPISLLKGFAKWDLTARFFSEKHDSVLVPDQCKDGLVYCKLTPERVTVRFKANRGLGTKWLIVPALFTIAAADSIVRDSVDSDEPVSLLTGHTYKVSATAFERWESRVYHGEVLLVPTAGKNMIVVPVREREFTPVKGDRP